MSESSAKFGWVLNEVMVCTRVCWWRFGGGGTGPAVVLGDGHHRHVGDGEHGPPGAAEVSDVPGDGLEDQLLAQREHHPHRVLFLLSRIPAKRRRRPRFCVHESSITPPPKSGTPVTVTVQNSEHQCTSRSLAGIADGQRYRDLVRISSLCHTFSERAANN